MSIPAAVIADMAILAASWTSFLEDQRSVSPSYILVLFFSASGLLAIPRMRSLWLMRGNEACKIIWTLVFVLTLVALILESVKKTRFLKSDFKAVSKEQLSGFWSRSLFTWLVPFLLLGYSKVFQLHDLPEVDRSIQAEVASSRLQLKFRRSHGRYRLLKSIFCAFKFTFLWAIPPRLALSAFTFSQAFLISSTIEYMQRSQSQKERNSNSGNALIGAYVLVYSGIAVSAQISWGTSD